MSASQESKPAAQPDVKMESSSSTPPPSVKPAKVKKPLTEERRLQLAKARQIMQKNAAARREKKQVEKQEKRQNKKRKKAPKVSFEEEAEEASTTEEEEERELTMEKPKLERESKHLVRDNGEAAERYLKSLGEFTDDITVHKSESRKRKGAPSVARESKEDQIDMRTALLAGLGLAGLGLASYVGGKNSLPAASQSGFTGIGSAIPMNQSTGAPAIPLGSIPLGGRPSTPSLGLFGA